MQGNAKPHTLPASVGATETRKIFGDLIGAYGMEHPASDGEKTFSRRQTPS